MKLITATFLSLAISLPGLANSYAPDVDLDWTPTVVNSLFLIEEGWKWTGGPDGKDTPAFTWTLTNPNEPGIMWMLVCDSKTGELLSISGYSISQPGGSGDDWKETCDTVMLVLHAFSGISAERLIAWSDGVLLDELLAMQAGKLSGPSAYEQYGWRISVTSFTGLTENPMLMFSLAKVENK